MGEWKTKVDYEDDMLVFRRQYKRVQLIQLEGGHHLAKLELVGKQNEDDALYLIDSEDEVSNKNAVRRIYKILNHKSKEQMYYAYQKYKEVYNRIKENNR